MAGVVGASDVAVGDPSFAETRVVRVMSITLQTAAVILLALNAPLEIRQAATFPLWWTCAAFVAIVVPALAIIIVGARAHPQLLLRLSGAQAIAFIVVLSLAPVSISGQDVPANFGLPWPNQLAVIAGSAAALAWGPIGAIVYGVVLQAEVFSLVFLGSNDPIPGQALGDAVLGLFFVTLFTVLALALRRAGVLLDRTVRVAVEDGRLAATDEATRTARRRVATLIHDDVIVALLTYSNQAGNAATAVEEAERALAAIRALDETEQAHDRPPIAFVWEMQALTTEHDPDAEFDYLVETSHAVPAEVAEAIGEAAAEALRNSVRHADPARRLDDGGRVERAVRVVVSDELVEVIILDDGAGFDLAEVAETRIGLRHGIRARLDGVAGGSAVVASRLGYGTTVALRWSPP